MTIKTVGDLIAELEGYDEDMPIRFLAQPNYPMVYTIGRVEEADDEDEATLYLLEGSQVGYGPRLF